MRDPNHSSRKPITTVGFSLASLALMVTVIAVLLASMNFDGVRDRLARLLADGSWYAWGLVGGATLVGAIVGWAQMIVNGFSWRALILAPVNGVVAGALGVMILVAPNSLPQTLVTIVIVLGATMLFRLDAE